eukprot:6152611-Prorocentrum_lima.AAC.1
MKREMTHAPYHRQHRTRQSGSPPQLHQEEAKLAVGVLVVEPMLSSAAYQRWGRSPSAVLRSAPVGPDHTG